MHLHVELVDGVQLALRPQDRGVASAQRNSMKKSCRWHRTLSEKLAGSLSTIVYLEPKWQGWLRCLFIEPDTGGGPDSRDRAHRDRREAISDREQQQKSATGIKDGDL